MIFIIPQLKYLLQAGTPVSICIRSKKIFRGGRFGPWRFVTGTVRQGFRPDFAGVGVGAGGTGVDLGVSRNLDE